MRKIAPGLDVYFTLANFVYKIPSFITCRSIAMSQEELPVETNESPDTKADVWAVMIMFTAALGIAIHFVSGFTFDF